MDRRTIEGIEACRPQSDDLQTTDLSDVARRVEQDPQVKALYDRVQKWDAAVGEALEQVPVPVDLAARILDRLQNSHLAPAALAPAAVDVAAVDVTVAALPSSAPEAGEADHVSAKLASRGPRFRGSRRAWLATAATMAAGLLLAAFFGNLLPSRSASPLETIADSWMQGLGSEWQNIQQAPRGFVLPGAITAAPNGWQKIGRANLRLASGVAFRLQAKVGTGTLFVVKLASVRWPSVPPLAPPAEPQSTTGGQAIGFWQSGGMVYMLVVPGDSRVYRAFVRTSPIPVA